MEFIYAFTIIVIITVFMIIRGQWLLKHIEDDEDLCKLNQLNEMFFKIWIWDYEKLKH